MSLERALAHFRNHQEKFSEEHHRQFVLIHDEEVEGFYDDEMSAYMAGQKKFKPGSFLLRQCIRRDEETPAIFRSRVA